MTITYRRAKQDIQAPEGIFAMASFDSPWGNALLPVPRTSHANFTKHFHTTIPTIEAFYKYTSNLLCFRMTAPDNTVTFNAGEVETVTGASNATLFVTTTGTSPWHEDNGANLFLRLNDLSNEINEPTFLTDQSLFIASRYPGPAGNTQRITIANNSIDFYDTHVFPVDADVESNPTLFQLFGSVPLTDEVALLVTADAEILEWHIVSFDEDAPNYIEEFVFDTIFLTVNQGIIPSNCTRVALTNGVSTALTPAERAEAVGAMRLNTFDNVAVIFAGLETLNVESTALLDRKLPTQILIHGGSVPSTLSIPPMAKNDRTHGWVSYEGDIAGMLIQKLNSESFDEIFSLPSREFLDIYSVEDYNTEEKEIFSRNRVNWIERVGSNFFFRGNFSDINTGFRGALNVRLLTLFVELRAQRYLKSILFEGTPPISEVESEMESIRNAVRNYMETFTYEVRQDGRTIEVELFETLGVPFRKLVFEIGFP